MSAPTVGRTDEQIQREVLDELKWDPRVRPNEIAVVVKDGIVTLTGWVDSLFQKWAAEEAAKRVSGVQAVANDIEVRLPATAQRTDADLAAEALWALEWDANVPTDRLKVTVSKGVVMLEGEVDWEFQKEDAERVVRRLTGVRGVINGIAVRPRPPASPEEVKRNVEQALARSALADARRITVDVQGSMVTLRGTVYSFAEKREAERAARSAPGVDLVVNRISVAR